MNPKLSLFIASAALAALAPAREFHVALSGDDANPGSKVRPVRTIRVATILAQPGDVITVHEGVYRERVDPPRGGSSERRRITYQAAPGEKVVITGSEPARGWERVTNDTWRTVIPNQAFGSFNPYCDLIRGDWFSDRGRPHHTGAVYLNDEWLTEARDLTEVTAPAGKAPLWFAAVDGDPGRYLANLAWFQTSTGQRVPAAAPDRRYGGKPAPCSEGGDCAGYHRLGDWLLFERVDFGERTVRLELRAAAVENHTLLEFRLHGPDGPLLGTQAIPSTGDWQAWRFLILPIQPVQGKQTVCVRFKTRDYDSGSTRIYAQFPGVDPNAAKVEINHRQTVFYPSRNFINHLTVRGFILKNAASNWAPPSAEQTAILGSNWSRDWIIEHNTICYSTCSGLSLGKYGDGTDNTNDAGAADPYTACVRRALTNGWNRASVGGHRVRGNHIHHCEQTGIVGSLGCAFSRVEENVIYDIHLRNRFGGAEMAGIKFHGAIDVIIRDNHLFRCGGVSGIWLDWMAQGAQVVGNLMHDNPGGYGDIFLEMQHGPLLLANNLLLSERRSIALNAQSIALAHNLLRGPIANTEYDARQTPYHPPHATAIAGLRDAPSGGHRVYNNLFLAPCQLSALDNSRQPCAVAGNVYTKGSEPSRFDVDALVRPDFDPSWKLEPEPDGWFLTLSADLCWKTGVERKLVDAGLLGRAEVPNASYENPDGSRVQIATDYFGQKRNKQNPFPGPFELSGAARQRLKVWPKK